MSSYQEEYRKGYEDGMEAARLVANQMYKDGVEEGIKTFREFDGDTNATVYYHMTKLFEYLGVTNQNKLVDKYKTYVIEEAKSING